MARWVVIFAVSLSFGVALVGACGTNNRPQQSFVQIKGASPTPAPSVSPSPSPTAIWEHVDETTSCEAMDPAHCVGAFGFSVFEDGQWEAGPDHMGTVVRGSLVTSEFTTIDNDATKVAKDDLSQKSCDPVGTISGVSDIVKIALPDGSINFVYSLGGIPKQTCYWGNRADAARLHDDLRVLMQKYYPQPFP